MLVCQQELNILSHMTKLLGSNFQRSCTDRLPAQEASLQQQRPLCCALARCTVCRCYTYFHNSLNSDCADMQVQETTLDWLVGLAAATALHLGAAILPLKTQITRVLKALFAAPSKVMSPRYGQKKCLHLAHIPLRADMSDRTARASCPACCSCFNEQLLSCAAT